MTHGEFKRDTYPNGICGVHTEDYQCHEDGFRRQAQTCAEYHPEIASIFKGVVHHFVAFAFICGGDESVGQSGTLNWGFSAETFERAHTMPAIFYGGSCDSMPMQTSAVNEWISLAGANAPVKSDGTLESENIAERFIGLAFQTKGQTEIQQYDGQNYYIGSYYNDEGICTYTNSILFIQWRSIG